MKILFTILVMLVAINASAQWMPTSKRVDSKDLRKSTLNKSENRSILTGNITSVTPKHSFDVLYVNGYTETKKMTLIK